MACNYTDHRTHSSPGVWADELKQNQRLQALIHTWKTWFSLRGSKESVLLTGHLDVFWTVCLGRADMGIEENINSKMHMDIWFSLTVQASVSWGVFPGFPRSYGVIAVSIKTRCPKKSPSVSADGIHSPASSAAACVSEFAGSPDSTYVPHARYRSMFVHSPWAGGSQWEQIKSLASD